MLRAWLAAAFALTALPAVAADVSSFTLENGLQTVVIEDHRAPVVVQMVWYKVGSADEVRGKSGIAHYLEHLMFKGTDTLAAGELSKTVSANGGSDNAFTSDDYTAYYQRIAADRLELVMRMEADRMHNLQISPDDWKTERQVILEERSQRIDSNPQAQFSEQLNAAQYQNSAYGTPTIGWRSEMEALTREDALAWYHRYYAPNNAVLVVAGDVTPDEVRALAEKYYGPIPANADLAARVRPQEPQQLAERKIEFRDPRVAQPSLTRSYLAPERNPGDQKKAAALTVLADLLGGNSQTSVLGKKLIFGTGEAIFVSAWYNGLSVDKTTFGLSVVPAADVSLPEAETALDKALAEFMANGIDPDQFQRIKTQIHAGQIYAEDDVQGIAQRYGSALAQGFSVQDVQDWPAVLAAVTPEDVMAAAKELFDKRNAVTGYLEKPEPQEAPKP